MNQAGLAGAGMLVGMLVQAMKKIIFVVFLMFLVFTFFAFIQYQAFIVNNAVWIIIAAALLIVLWRFDFIILMKDYERAVIFRFGKVNRVGGPGWAVVIPPVETYTMVDLRTQTLDIPKQDVITKDRIELKIDAVIYLAVKKDNQSVISSVVEVEDYKRAITLYVISTIRDVIGSMTLDDVLSDIERLNKEVESAASKVSKEWGLAIEAAQIKDVDIPRIVIDAMHEQKAAVQKKLARIEGAEAQKIEIDAVRAAAEQLSDKALSYYYIRALERMGDGRATKLIFPLEFSSLLGSLAGKGGLKETGHGIEVSPQAISRYGPLLAEYLRREKARRTGKGGSKKKKHA